MENTSEPKKTMSDNQILAHKLAFILSSGPLSKVAAAPHKSPNDYASISLKGVKPEKLLETLFEDEILHEGDVLGVCFKDTATFETRQRRTGRMTRDMCDSLVEDTESYQAFAGNERTIHFVTPKNRAADVICDGDMLHISVAALDQKQINAAVHESVYQGDPDFLKLTTPANFKLVAGLISQGTTIKSQMSKLSGLTDPKLQAAAREYPTRCVDVADETGISQILTRTQFKEVIARETGLNF